MTNNILEELEIPHPPYRMSRPVVRLAAMEESSHKEDMEEARQSEEQWRIREEASWKEFGEQPSTPEQIDRSVESKAEDAKHRVDATPSPDVAAKETAKNEIEEARIAYERGLKAKAAEFSGEKKTLGSIEEEYESAEAALKRAEAEKKPQEVRRLTKLTQQYSDALEEKEAREEPEKDRLNDIRKKAFQKLYEIERRLGMDSPEAKSAQAIAVEAQNKWFQFGEKNEPEHPTGSRVGDVVTEGKVSARVLEVNAEGRPPRMETIEEPKPELVEVPRGKIEKGPDFSVAQSFDQLRELLITAGEVIGTTGKPYKADELIGNITDIRDTFRKEKGNLLAVQEMLQYITPAGGLREKVRNLLEQEAASLSVSPEVVAPSPDESLNILRQERGPSEVPGKKEVGSERVNVPLSPEIQVAREAAEAKISELKEPQPPAPEPVERPAQKEKEAPEQKPLHEYISPFDYVRGALDWAVEKSGTKPWLDTLAPRLESVFHRQMAEVRMMQQVRTQGLLNRANNKLSNWEATAQDAGWPMKLFYANRVRAWQKHANTCESRVDKYESVRHRWQEKHNDLQRQVSERYERELEPYRELATVLKSKEAAAMDVRKNLSALRQDALKKLAVAKADAGKRSSMFMSSRARRAIKEIEQEVKSLERLEAQADKSVAKARAPLARAQAGIDTWELKQKTIAQRMKFPEAAGLTRPKRTTVEAPPQAGIATTAGPEQSTVTEGPNREQRMAEEWQPADFVKRWNAYNVELVIEKPDEFVAFVASEQARLHQDGIPTRQQLLDLTQKYQQLRLSPNTMKKFKASRDLFAAKVNK
ncbi:MAG: hypothetical protein AAB375_01160 [Patescibacteria group bacterium]